MCSIRFLCCFTTKDGEKQRQTPRPNKPKCKNWKTHISSKRQVFLHFSIHLCSAMVTSLLVSSVLPNSVWIWEWAGPFWWNSSFLIWPSLLITIIVTASWTIAFLPLFSLLKWSSLKCKGKSANMGSPFPEKKCARETIRNIQNQNIQRNPRSPEFNVIMNLT